MNNQEYWEDRAIVKDKLLEKDIKKIEKMVLKLFKATRKEVLNELKIIYADIEATEYAKYQLEATVKDIDRLIDNLYKGNEENIIDGLKGIYKEMDKQASIDLEASFNTINDILIEEVIKTNWSGLSFSDRIYEHRRKVALTLKEELNKGLIRGDSLQDISRIMADKLNTSFNNTMRLVRTESCYVMNEATVRNYKDNGIKEYEFMAYLDSATSKICKKLDGKKFSIEEYQAGINIPPLHPNCRSCIIPVVEDLTKPIKVEYKSIEVNTKALNKYGQEIQFNLEGSKEEAKNRIIKTITELSNKYNTSLVTVNRNKNGKEAGKVDAGMNMYLSSSRKNDIVHEFAHSLSMTHREKLKLSNDKEFWKEMKKLNKEYKKAINSDRSKMISVYSTESVDEFLAEGFAHSYLREEIKSDWYGKDYEFSDKIMAIVNKYFLK